MKKTLMDWEQALIDIERIGYGIVDLIVDGINVSFKMVRSGNSLKFIFFVDGVWEGCYMDKDNDYGKRFGIAKWIKMSAKQIKLESKYYSKKQMEKRIADYNRIACYNSFHSNSKSVINTLKKNNSLIQLKHDNT